jgi:hypothetical protein
VEGFNYWVGTRNGAVGNLQHIFLQEGKTPAQWRRLIAAYKKRARDLSNAWKKSPDYVHRFFAREHRLFEQEGRAFIAASNAAIQLKDAPLYDLPAVERATAAFGRTSHRAFHLSDEEDRAMRKARHQANVWMEGL